MLLHACVANALEIVDYWNMTSAADRNNGNTHRLFFMKGILELYNGLYPEIPLERGTFSVTDPDLHIRGWGHPDPKIRGRGWGRSPKNFFQQFRPQFGLKISRGRPPAPLSWICDCIFQASGTEWVRISQV